MYHATHTTLALCATLIPSEMINLFLKKQKLSTLCVFFFGQRRV